MVSTKLLLLLCLLTTVSARAYDDYDGPPDDEPGHETTTATVSVTTTATVTATTTASVTVTTTASATTNSTTNKTEVTFAKKTSPVAGYKYTTVFGVHIFAASTVSDAKFQHVAKVIAAFLDNDQDGCVDIPAVLAKLKKNKAGQIVFKSDMLVPGAFNNLGYEFKAPQYDNGETNPQCSGTKATTECFDATLEECFHVVSDAYAQVFPKIFGLGSRTTGNTGSKLNNLLDKARGGTYLYPPAKYPTSAWYKYYDSTCDYVCQNNEYLWFGMAAYLDINKGRTGVKTEYAYINNAAVKAGDPKLVAIMTDTKSGYKLPTVAPTGSYKGPTTCATGTNLI